MFVFLILLGCQYLNMIWVIIWENCLQEFYFLEQNSDDIYQIDQVKIVLVNGGWIGKGLGNSIQCNYLFYVYVDFIYVVICEEYGVVGGVVIIGLYLLLFFWVICFVIKSFKVFGVMVVFGLCLVIVIQVFFYIGINVNLVLVMGFILLLISMGGIFLLFICIFFGIILSVSKYIELVVE